MRRTLTPDFQRIAHDGLAKYMLAPDGYRFIVWDGGTYSVEPGGAFYPGTIVDVPVYGFGNVSTGVEFGIVWDEEAEKFVDSYGDYYETEQDALRKRIDIDEVGIGHADDLQNILEQQYEDSRPL